MKYHHKYDIHNADTSHRVAGSPRFFFINIGDQKKLAANKKIGGQKIGGQKIGCQKIGGFCPFLVGRFQVGIFPSQRIM